MSVHYENDSATGEYLLLSAQLEHCDSDVSLEFKDGRWIVDGVVAVDTIKNAAELLTEAA